MPLPAPCGGAAPRRAEWPRFPSAFAFPRTVPSAGQGGLFPPPGAEAAAERRRRGPRCRRGAVGTDRSGCSAVMAAGSAAPRVLNVNVGVLGHIDSGKTALARALSTTGSTAAFDRAPQSRARGITLDLGFSCLRTALPPQLGPGPGELQFTLVDCPGHASLIRTIIGGKGGSGDGPPCPPRGPGGGEGPCRGAAAPLGAGPVPRGAPARRGVAASRGAVGGGRSCPPEPVCAGRSVGGPGAPAARHCPPGGGCGWGVGAGHGPPDFVTLLGNRPLNKIPVLVEKPLVNVKPLGAL